MALRGGQEGEKGQKQVGDEVGSEAGQGAGWGPEELDLHPGSGKLGDWEMREDGVGLGSWRDPSRMRAEQPTAGGLLAEGSWTGCAEGWVLRASAAGWRGASGLSGRGCRHRHVVGWGLPSQARPRADAERVLSAPGSQRGPRSLAGPGGTETGRTEEPGRQVPAGSLPAALSHSGEGAGAPPPAAVGGGRGKSSL